MQPPLFTLHKPFSYLWLNDFIRSYHTGGQIIQNAIENDWNEYNLEIKSRATFALQELRKAAGIPSSPNFASLVVIVYRNSFVLSGFLKFFLSEVLYGLYPKKKRLTLFGLVLFPSHHCYSIDQMWQWIRNTFLPHPPPANSPPPLYSGSCLM